MLPVCIYVYMSVSPFKDGSDCPKGQSQKKEKKNEGKNLRYTAHLYDCQSWDIREWKRSIDEGWIDMECS